MYEERRTLIFRKLKSQRGFRLPAG